MLMEMLMLFIILTIIFLLLSIYTMEDEPVLAIPIIMVGMIFSILCTYGLWDVEYFYTGFNSSVGNTSTYVYSTISYGDPYSYIFMLLFFIYCTLFVRAGFNAWQDALDTKGEMEYLKKNSRGRKL